MNERIEELILSAGDTGNRQVWFTRPEVKKLAELMLRECTDIAAGERSGWEARKAIEKHFGVEE